MIKNLTLFLLATFFIFNSWSQFQEKITANRPGQIISAYTVGKQTFQIENGINYTQSTWTGFKTVSFSDGLTLRLGLLERLEANVSLTPGNTNTFLGSTKSSSGFRLWNLQVAAKYNVVQGKGWIPHIAIRAAMTTRTPGSWQIGSNFLLVTCNTFDWFSVSTKTGVSFAGAKSGATFPYTLNLGFAVSESVNLFAEVFGNFDNINRPGFDGGIYVLPFDNFQLDLFGGYITGGAVRTWFAELGISYRIDWRGNN